MIFLVLLFVGISYCIDLKTAVEKALSYHPSLKALEEEKKGIEGKVLLYKSYLNPTLSVEIGNLGTSKESISSNPLYRLSYLQPLLLYPLATQTKEVVGYELSAFDQRIAQEKNALKSEVYLAFYSALHKKELLNIAKENYSISQEIYQFVRKLFDLGETTKLELFRAERELKLAENELHLAESDLRMALGRLSLLTGSNVEDVEGKLDELKQMEEINFEEIPQVKQYSYMIKSIQASVQVEKTLAKPQLSIEVLSEKVSQNQYGIRLGFSATLPVFYRREGEIIQLSAKASSLENLRQLELMKAKNQYKQLFSRYQTLIKQVQDIDGFMLAQAKEELSLALKSYRLKTISALELYDTKRRYIQLVKYRADLLMQAHQEYAGYISLGGQL